MIRQSSWTDPRATPVHSPETCSNGQIWLRSPRQPQGLFKPGKDQSLKTTTMVFPRGVFPNCFLGHLDGWRSVPVMFPPMEEDVQCLDTCFQQQSELGMKHWDAPNHSISDLSWKDHCRDFPSSATWRWLWSVKNWQDVFNIPLFTTLKYLKVGYNCISFPFWDAISHLGARNPLFFEASACFQPAG